MSSFLKTHKANITDGCNKKIILKGINLGGWLMMEGYILHSPNFPVCRFKKSFAASLGKKTLRDFEKSFRGNFIQEKDIKKISDLKFNCIRVPFHYRLIERTPYKYDKEGLKYLDSVIKWAKKYGLWVILDLHAAPGAQNCDWHSDSLGVARLWNNNKYQKRTFVLWEFLADRYKDEQSIAGYDILNESVVKDSRKLNLFYKKLIKSIRKVDKNHIIFVEGNTWAVDLKCLDNFDDKNIVLSIHTYQPLDFTFNFVKQLSYPIHYQGVPWDKSTIYNMLESYSKIAKKRNIPLFIGEFGVNCREGKYGEDIWLRDVLKACNSLGIHWTYWTYKAVKNSIFPDGLFSYRKNPSWVNRQGPLMGWDTYRSYWSGQERDIISSWKTKNFKENKKILKVLKDAVR